MSGIAPLIALSFLGGGPSADIDREHFPRLMDLHALPERHCYVRRDRCGELCMQFVRHGADEGGCDRYPSHAPRLIPVRR